MDYAKDFVQQRQQFEKPISELQGIQWMIADAFTELEAARLLVMNAVYCIQSGQDYTVLASIAKLYASEKALDRLSYHCHIIETGNDSYRFRHSTTN